MHRSPTATRAFSVVPLISRRYHPIKGSWTLLRYNSTAVPSNPDYAATDIAVLGGGITGLATAYYITKSLPNAKVTLYEASSRLGGWLNSQSVDVGTGKVVFEQGPRTLRPTIPNGWITLDLVSFHFVERLDCALFNMALGT